MDLKHLLEIVMAFGIVLILFILTFSVMVDSAVESLKYRFSRINVECSQFQEINSAKFYYPDLNIEIYCTLFEQ